VLWAVLVGIAVLALGVGIAGLKAFRFIKRVQQAGFRFDKGDAVEIASKELSPAAKATTTETDARKRAKEFRVRQWLEGYKERGNHNTDCDAASWKMLTAWIESQYGMPDTNAPPLSELCDSLASSPGCSDPLILAMAGTHATEVHEKIRRLELAIAGFEKSAHKAYPKLNAVVILMQEMQEDEARHTALFRQAYQLFNQCFRDGSFQPQDQPEIAEIFVMGWGSDFLNRCRDGLHQMSRAAGSDFEWLSLVLEGEFHISKAWKARGGGYANTVTEQGWKGFASHMDMARTNLAKAWKLRPDLPIAPSRMIYVALSVSDAREMRLWFDRAIAAQIDYPNAWSDMRWGLRPRWHGSLEAMLALGKLAADTKRYDTDVPRKFVDVVWDIESEMQLAKGEHIYGREDIWPTMQQVYEGYVSEPSAVEGRSGWRSSYAIAAYVAGKYDLAKAQLEALNWTPSPVTLSEWHTDLSLMSLEVAARTGPLAGRIAAAESSFRSSDLPTAFSAYKQLKTAPGLDERTRQFVLHRLAALELEKRLESGDWVDLMPTTQDDPAWVTAAGKIKSLADGALEIEADKFGHMLFSRARVGTNFEVKGEFEIVKSSNGAFQAGLVMGVPNTFSFDWYALMIKDNSVEKQVVTFNKAWSAQRISNPATVKGDRNSFQFRFLRGQASASLNGKQVMPPTAPTPMMWIAPTDFHIGLGAYNDMNTTVIRYRGVQVRRL
jgi:hypothetical protein